MKSPDSYLLGYHARVHGLEFSDVFCEEDLPIENASEFEEGWDAADQERKEEKLEALRATLMEIGELPKS